MFIRDVAFLSILILILLELYCSDAFMLNRLLVALSAKYKALKVIKTVNILAPLYSIIKLIQ